MARLTPRRTLARYSITRSHDSIRTKGLRFTHIAGAVGLSFSAAGSSGTARGRTRQWNKKFAPTLTTFAVSFESLLSKVNVPVARSVAFGVSVWFWVPKFR